jgi:predicted amidohydrolase
MELSTRGAEIVIVPAAWPAARREHWRLLTTARALEHQIFVVACNAAGVQEGVELGGHSRVVDPAGNVLAEADAGESVLMVDIDPQQVGIVRNEFPVLNDRLASYETLTV